MATEETTREQPEWRSAVKKPIEVEYREVEGEKERIQSREGDLLAIAGEDLIIRGIDGELYPISKDIFEETYEVLEQADEGYEIGTITSEASEIVSEDRPDTHGDAYLNHKHIADLWKAFLGVHIEAWEVAVMMTMLKASRARQGSLERDHFRDIAGYADVAYACVQEREDE